jgi:uncharacterized protein (DUF1800 family)
MLGDMDKTSHPQFRLTRRDAIKKGSGLSLNTLGLTNLGLARVGLKTLIAPASLGVSGVAGAASPMPLKLPNAARHLSSEQVAAHLLNRLGYGPRPSELASVAANPLAWIQAQLAPSSLSLPESLRARLDESAFLSRHPLQVVQEFRSLQRASAQAVVAGQDGAVQAANAAGLGQGTQDMQLPPGTVLPNRPATSATGANPSGSLNPLQQAAPQPAASPIGRFVNSVARPAIESRLLRAIESPRQLEEVMVDFWFNHFNIFQGKNTLRVMTGHYEHYAIRPFAMGRFRDLLGATARHPAMLYYLDNALSVAPGTIGGGRGNAGVTGRGLNENYARELMELHTLGVDGGYRQKDVTELARMLTGWSIQPPNRVLNTDMQAAPGNLEQMPGFWFNERVHDQGEKEWLGHRVLAQGQREGEFALDVLAKHPSTAKHIAFKLAQYFVTDQPAPALVKMLAQVFSDNDGAIVPVLTMLFSHEDFWAKETVGSKFKTPYHYVLSVVRATGFSPTNLQALSGAMANQGMPLYGCPTPDGYRNTESAWLNPDAMTKRINFATLLTSTRASNLATLETLVGNLGPLVSEQTKVVAREASKDPSLASALVLAGPLMMRR